MKLILLMAVIGVATILICCDTNRSNKRYDNQDLMEDEENV